MSPLRLDERHIYDAFVKKHQLTAFHHSWWLDASCGANNWSAVFAYDKNGELAAVWPFFRRYRLGGLLTTMDKPLLSLFCGPWISAVNNMNPAKALSRYHRLFRQLESQLPTYALRRAYLSYDITNTMPAQKLGWHSRCHHSYRLRCDKNTVEQIWQQLDGKVRTDLKHYKDVSKYIKPLEDVDLLIELQRRALDYRSSKIDFPYKSLSSLHAASRNSDQSIGWMFEPPEEGIAAAIWLVKDSKSAYLIIAASDPSKRSEYKAISQLIWHAINYCCKIGLVFDFEGSTLPGVEEFYRGWGGEVATYCSIVKKRWSWLPG